MKKTINFKSTAAITISLIMAIAIAVFVIHSISATGADENKPETLMVGKYMHTSGDESKYIEVFDDKTLQVFGYDFIEDQIKINAEFKDSMEKDEEFAKFSHEHNEWYKQRHSYAVDNNVNFCQLDDSNYGFKIIDEKTLSNNEFNVYVYAG